MSSLDEVPCRATRENLEVSSLLYLDTVQGIPFYLTSDLHLDPNQKNIVSIATQYFADEIDRSKARILFLLGDLFDSRNGQDTSRLINQLIQNLSGLIDNIIFVPGNNDLRGRPNPFQSFNFSKDRVLSPVGAHPIVATIEGLRILAGNIFADFERFIPYLPFCTRDSLLAFYASKLDGKSLFDGNMGSFPAMTDALAQKLDPRIDVLATHYLSHPSSEKLRCHTLPPARRRVVARLAISTEWNPDADLERYKWFSRDLEKIRIWLNSNTFLLGANVLQHPRADLGHGLTCLHGHNHHGQRIQLEIGDRSFEILSHQPFRFGK